ncbi:molybdenum cofactor guanylyltransferase [mine drainage metagenome]|uniref:Molybdenum cofactor guanylyltransferase n=1 Tax=mine drainage metagenome TaxID=410659 RepID=A0A1J5RC21_9ZZZZ
MVLACDMIDMNAEILKALLKNHEDSVYTDVSVYKNDDRVEPLCSIYSSKALQKIITLLKANQLTKHSMLFALEQLNTNYIQLKEEWKPAFKNYNTPNDLHTT